MKITPLFIILVSSISVSLVGMEFLEFPTIMYNHAEQVLTRSEQNETGYTTEVLQFIEHFKSVQLQDPTITEKSLSEFALKQKEVDGFLSKTFPKNSSPAKIALLFCKLHQYNTQFAEQKKQFPTVVEWHAYLLNQRRRNDIPAAIEQAKELNFTISTSTINYNAKPFYNIPDNRAFKETQDLVNWIIQSLVNLHDNQKLALIVHLFLNQVETPTN